MTIDEQLSALDDSLRRLKIEYDVFFGGGSKRPPNDTEFRVQSLTKRLADNQRLTYSQRFRYNALAQKYAVFSDLWRQKLKIKEEGYRRAADAQLGIQGIRTGALDEKDAAQPSVVLTTADDSNSVRKLYETLNAARDKAGLPATGTFESFKSFISLKTGDLRKHHHCPAVEYTVEVKDHQVRLKAKPVR